MVHSKTDDYGGLHSSVSELADSGSKVGTLLCGCTERCSIPEHRQDGELQKHVGTYGPKYECTLRFLYWE